ncbi:hypothetical protein ECBCE008MS01_3142 [Escherichia coli BCE008_MS-01]|nr:hypothetical protein ECMP02101710_3064 [Escherichia coli MP021017.10]ENB13344.1 hypothetical protein ECBCE008MS01_3142 [Escherichia coli BCE008_MS-01]
MQSLSAATGTQALAQAALTYRYGENISRHHRDILTHDAGGLR